MRYELLHPKALRAALIKRLGEDAVPSERQVRRWVTGGTPMPGWARREVRALMAETAESASPGGTLTRRLLIGVMALERREAISPEELDAAEAALEADAQLAAELERFQRKPGGQAKDQADGQSDVSPGSRRRKR